MVRAYQGAVRRTGAETVVRSLVARWLLKKVVGRPARPTVVQRTVEAIDVRSLGASVHVIIVVEVRVRLIVAHLMEVAIVARANVAYHSFPTADLPSFVIQILTLHYVDLHARIWSLSLSYKVTNERRSD